MSNNSSEPRTNKRPPYRARLPGFVNAEDIGLGEAVKRVTSRVGIRPCGHCLRRAAALDRRVIITRWKQ